jgi:hypothetical protein
MKETLELIELIFKLIGGLAAGYIFFIGFKRYEQDQKWKRNEFVAKELKAFFSNIHNRNAMLMLDWGDRPIELYPNHPEYKERFVIIGRDEVISALIPHKHKSRYTKHEAIIRDTFDDFLSELEKFNHFVKIDLIKPEEFEPYLKYWINTIADDLPEKLKCTLHIYIENYGYTGVQSFFEKFNKDIKPKRTYEACQALPSEDETLPQNLGS